tara:strand:+ start:885 stop:1055 length:171 start_codon:yes stop_codon:yes gene_type:complete
MLLRGVKGDAEEFDKFFAHTLKFVAGAEEWFSVAIYLVTVLECPIFLARNIIEFKL